MRHNSSVKTPNLFAATRFLPVITQSRRILMFCGLLRHRGYVKWAHHEVEVILATAPFASYCAYAMRVAVALQVHTDGALADRLSSWDSRGAMREFWGGVATIGVFVAIAW